MRRLIFEFTLIASLCTAAYAQEVGMQINSTDNVHFIIVDPQGQRTGVDPRGATSDTQWVWLREIPSSHYSYETVGNLDSLGPVTYSMQFLYSFNTPDGDGTYLIHVIGNMVARFNLSISITGSDSTRVQNVEYEVKDAPLDKDSASTYRLTYHGLPGSAVSLIKAVSARSLVQDIAAMFKLKWVTTQITTNKYSDWFRAYGSQYLANNFGAARATLDLALANLKADSGNTLNANAYRSLRSDVEQLVAEMPTVLASMDTLISIKHRSFSMGWLGDANFVKELDNGLDNAKKHLANKDSVNAYKEVQTFQDKVNSQYEKTVDDQKKGKPRDKRFVTVEGWKFLYYNAQYIMDRLPGGKKK